MLGIATGEILRGSWKDVPIIRLNEHIWSRKGGIIYGICKLIESLEVTLNSSVCHSTDGKHLWEFISHEYFPIEESVFQAVVYRSVFEAITIQEGGGCTLETGGAVVEATRRRSMDKESIWPGGTRDGREPLVANS